MKVLCFIMLLASVWTISQIRLVKNDDRIISCCNVVNYEDLCFTSIEDIAEYAKIKTASDLTFSKRNDITNCKANCVGYAQYAATICNKLLKYNNINMKAKPVVGCYYFRDVNIHKVLLKFISDRKTKNFIKDHDYVEIVDNFGDVVYSFDPSVYDLTSLSFNE